MSNLFEWLGRLRIIASPLVVGLIAGGLFYLWKPDTTGIAIGSIIALSGLVLGIRWANRKAKGKGTIWFLARILGTPAVDESEKEDP